MTREDILIEAHFLITSKRAGEYGDAHEMHARIATIWSDVSMVLLFVEDDGHAGDPGRHVVVGAGDVADDLPAGEALQQS